MGLTREAAGIFALLLPGFVASILLDLLLVRRPKDHAAKVIEALVLSFLIYAIVTGLAGIYPVTDSIIEIDGVRQPFTHVAPKFLVATTGVAITLPLLFSY